MKKKIFLKKIILFQDDRIDYFSLRMMSNVRFDILIEIIKLTENSQRITIFRDNGS